MATAFTPGYNMTLPEIGGEPSTWGNMLNANLSTIDEVLGQFVGDVCPMAVSTEPDGWLKCNGQTVSRTTYDRLWAWVQASGLLSVDEPSKFPGGYGPGDGSTTFSLPDFRGESLRVWDDGKGVDTGRGLGTFQAGQVEDHGHSTESAGDHSHTTQSAGDHSHSGNTGSGGAHTHGYEESLFRADFLFSGSANGWLSTRVDFTTGSAGAHSHTLNINSNGDHSHTLNLNGAHAHTLDSAGAHTHTVQNAGGESRVRNVAISLLVKT